MIDLNDFSKEIHEHNVKVGWWDNNPKIEEKFQLALTEIAEATEGERKDLIDDHLPHRKMGEVELADALIRVLDIAEHLEVKYLPKEKYYNKFLKGKNSVAYKHWFLSKYLIDFYIVIKNDRFSYLEIFEEYTFLVNSILFLGDQLNYDVLSAAREKFEYNKTRTDHTREERSKNGGKKF